MLFFLSIAAKTGFVIDEYVDNPVGTMARDAQGRHSMTRVVLRPEIRFVGDKHPTVDQIRDMHDQSHEQCYIANSVKTEVIVELL